MEPNCSSAIGISSLSILSIILSQNVLVLFGINLKIERVRPIISSVAKLRFYEINCDNFVHAIVHDIYCKPKNKAKKLLRKQFIDSI